MLYVASHNTLLRFFGCLSVSPKYMHNRHVLVVTIISWIMDYRAKVFGVVFLVMNLEILDYT